MDGEHSLQGVAEVCIDGKVTKLVEGLKVVRLDSTVFSVEVAMLVLTVEDPLLGVRDGLVESCLLMERLGKEEAMLMVGLEDTLLGKSVFEAACLELLFSIV